MNIRSITHWSWLPTVESTFLDTMSQEICTPMNGVIGMDEVLSRESLPEHQAAVADAPALPFHAGRDLEYAALRRQRPGPGHLPAAGRAEGGSIDVCSTQGEGSTFTGALPMKAVSGVTPPEGADLEDLDCIVIGSYIVAEDLRIVLEHAGARVSLVADLEAAALQAVGTQRPVLIHNTGVDRPRQEATVQNLRFAALAEARHLVITRGALTCSVMPAMQVTSMDGNGLQSATLVRMVAVAAGRASSRAPVHLDIPLPSTQPRAPTVAEARAQGRLILIAEDDRINQLVILRQIEVLGYAGEVASNGAEALRLLDSGPYGLLLTNLHMPEMDGYSLAQVIRGEEARRQRPWQQRLPILALTANALRGEAIRAEAAGMDGYLTKPMQLHLFEAALRKWLPIGNPRSESHQAPSVAAPAFRAAAGVLHTDLLHDLIGDDPALVRRLLYDYQTSARRLAIEMRVAFVADDFVRLGAITHELKSSSRSVGALNLGDLCAELENACRTLVRKGIARSMADFDAEQQVFDARMGEWLARPIT